MNPTPGNFLSAAPGGYSKTAITKRQTNKTEKPYTMLALKSDSWQPNNFRLSDDQVILHNLLFTRTRTKTQRHVFEFHQAPGLAVGGGEVDPGGRRRSEEHTSELQSL